MPALHVTGNVMSTDATAGYAPLLEISTKSKSERGRHMSAFHMTATTKEYGKIKLELAFQGSKVFERGGRSRIYTGKERRRLARRSEIRD